MTDDLLNLINTFGTDKIHKKDLYKYLMGDERALDKYIGDPRHSPATPEETRAALDAMKSNDLKFEWINITGKSLGYNYHLSHEIIKTIRRALKELI